jgi:diphthine-ammonia ligase
MYLFPLANAAYISYFGISPPSRATVAVPLPEDVGVRIEVVGYDDTPVGVQPASGASRIEAEGAAERRRVGGRSALHVQSLSYWAPANIGPYSQAITVSPWFPLICFPRCNPVDQSLQ